MLCAMLCLEILNKAKFSDLNALNKAEYTRTITAEQILLLKYQPNYNNNRKYQSEVVNTQLMFAERGKTGYHEGEKNRIKQKLKNLDHATCNDCGVKGHYKRSSE